GDIQLAGAAALGRDNRNSSFDGESVEVPLQIRSAHQVHNDIHPTAAGDAFHFGDEIGFLVVNGMLRSEFQARGALAGASGGNDYGCAPGAREHDGYTSDAAASAVN